MRWLVIGVGILLVIAAAVLATPLWLRPLVAARASAALGRTVEIGRLEFQSWHPPRVVLHDVRLASPPQLAAQVPNLATVERLELTLDLVPAWHLHLPDVPQVVLAGLKVTAVQAPDGANNYTVTVAGGGGAPRIGVIRVQDSSADLQLARFGVTAQVALHTEQNATIVADIDGSYRGQPVRGRVLGAPVGGLADSSTPYAVEAHLEGGGAKLAATGTVNGALQPSGAQLKLDLSGVDLAGLQALTGIPFPPTPPFHIAADTTYEGGVARLAGLRGQLGSSDIAGNAALDLRPDRPVLSGDLTSRRVDLQDLAGLIGSQPGRLSTPGLTPAQRQAVARAEANPRLIPTVPMDIPRIQAADFHIAYRGEHVIGRAVPFDSIAARLDIDAGHIRVSDLRVAVGRGAVAGSIDMAPSEGTMRTRADLQLQRIDVRRLLAAAGNIFHGDGLIGGRIEVDSAGRSLAEILQRGTGRLTFFMAGGSVSQLVIDLSGLQIGSALLSAIGLPSQTQVRCLIGDLALARGALATRTLLLDTANDRTVVQGSVDLRDENIHAVLRTSPKHFTIGSLAAPIIVTGTLKNPNFAPEAGELAARSGAAVGLGLLLAPAALLPTIQLGIGDDNACVAVAREARSQ